MKNALADFYNDIIRHLELNHLRGFTRALIFSFVLLTCTFILFFLSVISTKLDEDTKYYVNATSEFYKYYPAGATASSVLIQNFRISEGCDEFEGEKDPEKMFLSFAKGSEVRVSRFGSSTIRIDVLSGKSRFKESGSEKSENSQSKVADLEGEVFKNCVSFEISLSEQNPVFTMNTLGETSIGKEITDSIDTYSPLFLSGEVIVEGRSTISQSLFTYEPIQVPRGASITTESNSNKSIPTGVLRASLESEGIDSTIMIYGGTLLTQLYREKPRAIEISFINRLSSDNEAVIGFSALIILLQFLSAIIAFLMRLKFINSSNETPRNIVTSKRLRMRKIRERL